LKEEEYMEQQESNNKKLRPKQQLSASSRGKAIAKIFVKLGSGEYRQVAEKKLNLIKLDNEGYFHYSNHSFVVDLSKVAYYNAKGYPVLYYMLDNSIPATLTARIHENKEITLLEGRNTAGVIPNSVVWDEQFRRQKLRAILASATKLKDQLPLALIITYVSVGLLGGVLLGIAIYPSLFLHH
jgi:hypothetical protein